MYRYVQMESKNTGYVNLNGQWKTKRAFICIYELGSGEPLR